MLARLKNELMHAICAFEAQRTVCPNLGRGQHGFSARIPKRRTQDTLSGRYVVEQTFGLLDQFRRIRVRYEKLARNFKSMHFLALSAIVVRRL